MKNNIRKIAVSALIIVMSITACTDNFEEINTNPNAFDTATPELLLPGVMYSILDMVGGEMNFWMYLQYGRYSGGMTGNPMHLFGTGQFNDNYWTNLYIQGIQQCREVQRLYKEEPSYQNRIEISKILESYIFSVILSTWGPAPVVEAAKGDLFNIPFDDELEGYQYILENLQNASDVIATNMAQGIALEDGSSIPADQLLSDPLFKGDNDLWVRFANTLRLKIALRLSNATEEGILALSSTNIQDVAGNDLNRLILNNSQNAVLYWGENNQTNFSTLYEQDKIIERENQRPSITDELLLWFAAYNDPRYEAIAQPAKEFFVVNAEVLDESDSPIEVRYALNYMGSPIGGTAPYNGWGLLAPENPYNGSKLNNFSKFNEYYLSKRSEFMLISSAETYFMLAEVAQRGLASGLSPAAVYYDKGIDESFARYAPRITQAFNVEAYKNQPGIDFNTASDQSLNNWTSTSATEIKENEGLKQIIVQRWITMFIQGHDAWCLQKRTNLLPWAPFMNPAERGTPLDHLERMEYAPGDMADAPKPYEVAISQYLNGPDLITTPLDMNKNRIQTDWPGYNASFSNDFAARWYGDSVEDLEAAGLTDVTGMNAEEQQNALKTGTGYIRL